MNVLGIDYGTKNIGLAYAISGIISTIPAIKNDPESISNIVKVINEYHIEKVYIGVSQGKMATKTYQFIDQLRPMLKLDIETVEESVSTIEATEIYKQNRHQKRFYKQQIDSVSAAVILNRVISSV